jgi:glyoxylase-like metal-dependent hydrolase (beta-lactamase superfamily II)
MTQKFKLKLEMHQADLPVYESAGNIAKMYGIPFNQGPHPEDFLDENSKIELDGFTLDIFHTPGHSPGSICFYSKINNFLIGGDVLFNGSIGRTDLPGGDFDILSESIKTKLYTLPDHTRVFSGHGESTLIGNEKLYNPFIKA